MHRAALLAALPVALLVASLSAGCAGDPEEIGPTGVDLLEIPTPSADPDDFVATIDNPYLPLTPGSTWVYERTDRARITVSVTDETREVQGVDTTVVREQVTAADGEVLTDTYEWYAQDTDGNVWAFGEEPVGERADADGSDGTTSDAGASWEAGVDGAQAGIAMLAEPRVGDGYRRGLLPGVVEHRATVVTLDAAVELDLGRWTGVLQTEETPGPDADPAWRSFYVRDVGLVLQQEVGGSATVQVVEFTEG